jgi:hypothetical protein
VDATAGSWPAGASRLSKMERSKGSVGLVSGIGGSWGKLYLIDGG